MTKVVELRVPDAALEERVCGRWIHEGSGRSYHVAHAPPKGMVRDAEGAVVPASMTDDETGEVLVQREDDTAAALAKRLRGYHEETEPILAHYQPSDVVSVVDADQTMEEVWGNVLIALE